MPMLLRNLGKTGEKVPAIGLGCMGMSEFYGETNEEECIATLLRSIELGSTFWDTADMYGAGANEKLLSKVLKTHREKIFLCTKFGFLRGPKGEMLGIRGDPEHVREACNASLERLGVDVIDLYYQHRVDPKTPIEDTVRAMAELVKEGKVRYLGLSECSAATLRRAYAVHPIAAVQIEYSPWSLDIEQNGILEACRELGVTIVAYSPFSRGLLAGRIKSIDDLHEKDVRRFLPRTAADGLDENMKLVQKFDALSQKKGVATSQYILAWIHAQGEDFIPIPGTKRVQYLEENVKGCDITLSPEELQGVRDIINTFGVKGERYPEAAMSSVNI